MFPLAALAAIFVAGCGGDRGQAASNTTAAPRPATPTVTVNAGEEHTLFPLAVGNQWVYETETTVVRRGSPRQERTEGSLTFRVAKVDPAPNNGKRAVLEILNNGRVNERQTWLVDSTGIYQLQAGGENVAFNPRLPSLKFPIETGARFNWKGTGLRPSGERGEYRNESVVRGPEEADAANERIPSIAVATNSQWGSNNQTVRSASIAWWAPKIGIVRFRQEILGPGGGVVQVLRLKSYTLK